MPVNSEVCSTGQRTEDPNLGVSRKQMNQSACLCMLADLLVCNAAVEWKDERRLRVFEVIWSSD